MATGTRNDLKEIRMTDDIKGTPGGQPPEKVGNRPFVGEVKPDDYPAEDRAEENPNGAVDNRDALRPDEHDRAGAGEIQGEGHSAVGKKKDPADTNRA